MNAARTASLGLALLLSCVSSFATGCAAETDDEDTGVSADAVTDGKIVIKNNGGPTIAKWGYDVKQDGRSRALKPALAKEIFVDIGMNLLRVPVRARAAHPERGVDNIKAGEYVDDLEAIANVKAVRPGVDVFASVKLLGKNSFPKWVETGGGEVDAGAYATLIENYLAFMKSKGVTIDFLGVDNERKFNEGNITPGKYNKIASDVKDWCRGNDVKVPDFIAAEDYGPSEDTGWLKDLWASPAKFQHVDHIGVHIYSKHRDGGYLAAMNTLSNNLHGKKLWDTELHWNDLDQDDEVKWDDLRRGMLTAMDHFDQGYHALSWWAFQPRSRGTKASFIMSELVSSTVGASLLPTDDVDGKAPASGKLNTRAFKNGPKTMTLWVGNFDGKDRKGQRADVSGEDVAAASYVQWSPQSAIAGKTGNASLTGKGFTMNYPSNTITRVKVTLK